MSFKDDIEAAERLTLIISWIGVFSAIGIIAFAVLGI